MSPATRTVASRSGGRRDGVTPEQIGLPSYGPRRVKGLRREEVASLAGVSVYSAEPGSRSAEALDLLASWTATPAQASIPADG